MEITQEELERTIAEAVTAERKHILERLKNGVKPETITEEQMKEAGKKIVELFSSLDVSPSDSLIVLEFCKFCIWEFLVSQN